MAAIHQHQHHRYTKWSDYYGKLLENEGEGLSTYSIYDEMTLDYLNDEEKYLNAILENPKVNFIVKH